MCPKYKKEGAQSFVQICDSHSTYGSRENNNPAWFNLQDWSVPVNINAHAGRVRALLSVCLLHADTIRIAVRVPESHHLLSNTHTGESRTERCDWGRPGPSGHRALIAKLFFSSVFNRCNTPATEKRGCITGFYSRYPSSSVALPPFPSFYALTLPTLFLATPSLPLRPLITAGAEPDLSNAI